MEVVDLFSGLGGFSQAFLDRNHNVKRYDFDVAFKEVPNTTIKDIMELKPINLKHADIILASPPCTHFSIASVYRHWIKGIPTEATEKQIELVKYTISLIKETNPKYWILENPKGMLRKVLGKPDMITYWAAWKTPYLKPTHLWGKLPPIDWKSKSCATWEKSPRGSKTGIQGSLRNPAQRALIPYAFSLAVCLAAEGISQQTTLV